MITEAVFQIAAEATRVVVYLMARASAGNNQRAKNVGSKLGRTIMKLSTLDQSSTGKCAELRPGRQGLQLIEDLTQVK